MGQGLSVDSQAPGVAYLSEDLMLAAGPGQPQDPPEPQTWRITAQQLPLTRSLQPLLPLRLGGFQE